ncbi:GNAT family N-acetyltransferase [Hutsoniella sourekii]
MNFHLEMASAKHQPGLLDLLAYLMQAPEHQEKTKEDQAVMLKVWLDWLQDLDQSPSSQEVEPLYYVAVNQDQDLIGLVIIRRQLADPVSDVRGHIGYVLHPRYRGQGLANQLLAQAIDQAKILGMSKLILTADSTNTASNQVIINQGGSWFESRIDPESGHYIHYYRI